MPFFAPASNVKTGNGEDLYIPVSDIADSGPVDVINGNLLVTGTLTSGEIITGRQVKALNNGINSDLQNDSLYLDNHI